MTKEILMHRLKQYALGYARLVLRLPYNIVNKNYADQGNRSASSSTANYRAACRAKSHADFINKLKIVEEELDESIFFLEMIVELNPSFGESINLLHKEGDELLAIIVASLKTLHNKKL
ncbi:four helix bundle protein [Parafilimonas terrae]|uniref:Four helix bundle protein n=1 Tax=Parafilimonas terrae TaxID=1465490 RepID=A0A1I5Y9H9_9BACT|nr:four helix bundle protein [Parafilimonas terrae]SFQ40891.1 four helix bundle protein [Parafilimonas terrae]